MGTFRFLNTVEARRTMIWVTVGNLLDGPGYSSQLPFSPHPNETRQQITVPPKFRGLGCNKFPI